MSTKGKIVVVEDNAESLYLMTFLLEKTGYQVVSATTGEDGLNLVRQERPVLVVLDMQLPIMSGYEVATCLKGDPKLKDIPIVAITSYAMPGDREAILAAGCDGYLQKPIDPETLIADIAVFIGYPDSC